MGLIWVSALAWLFFHACFAPLSLIKLPEKLFQRCAKFGGGDDIDIALAAAAASPNEQEQLRWPPNITSGINYANDKGDIEIVEWSRSKMHLDIFASIICNCSYYQATFPSSLRSSS